MISNFSLLTVGKFLVLASLLAGLVGVHDVTVLSQTNTDNELFTDSPIAGTLSISGRPEIIRTRFVMVNISALGGIKGVSPQDTLILNLFPDAVFTARLRHIEWAPGGYVWIGRIEEKQLSDVLLSVVGDIVMGSIIMPGAVYSIEYAGGEYGGKKVHAIHEINQGAFPPDEGHAGPVIPPENSSTAPLINKPTGTATSPKSAMQASGQSTLNTSAPDTDAFIDVMVVYTPAARAAAGGTTAMQAHVNLMISQTNTAYANSNITTRLRLVRTDEVGYTESGDMDLDLNRITNCSDGFMDIVCTWRNTYSADLVALIVENGQYCGIAWLNDSSADAPRGFSVTLRTCATANITFAHEVGHNQGMCHDWYVDGPGCEVFGWATYSYGYVDDDLGDRWRTIMAYNTRCSDQGFNCTRILYFSNPSVLYSGGNPNQPTGVNPGTNTSCLVGQIPTTECDAHNARTLNESDIVIANFRQTNDNFANAQVISGNSGTVTGSNVWATKEPGEPNHAGNAGGASVWYRWTPSTSGSATIDTIGSNFDTLLAVYIGSAVNSLTLIASNDDIGGGNLQSRVTFSATAGTTYSIAVDGYGGATGNITLNWSLTTTTNRILTVAGAGTGNGTVTATGISCTITAGSTSGDCSESYPDGTSVTLTATAASGSTFAGWTNCDAPSGNQCTMTMNANKTVTATFNVVMRTLTVTGAGTGNGTVTATGISCTITAGSTSGDCSESYPDGTSVTLTATAASGSTFAGWTNCDAPSGNQCTMTMNANKTVTATFNVVMRTLTVTGAGTGSGTVTATGISCTITAGSTSGDCSESYPDGTSVTLTATAASGSTFAGWTNCDAPSGNQCTMTMNANKTVTATFNILGPANDNFANAQDISGDSGNITGSNVGATKEPCEPNHHNIPGGASVWYRWTAPIGGNATFDTFGSNFDTVLAVYTGDNLCSLTYIASSDDDPLGGLQSRVSFNAVAGTTYHIAVDGFGGFSSSGVERAFGDKISTAAVAMGDIVLNWSVVEAQADEDFETGNLSKFPWETGGRDRWIVTNAASHSGNYSARAPLSLRDGRQAYLQVTLLVETGMISFWRKVSSEQNRDFLKFYIDGVLQGQWSGEVDWEQVSFPVTAGEHTFKWVYTKDRSRSGGQDTAWIDDIDFPPLHPCYGVTISSSPASVTYRPTPTRPDRKTIRVTVTNQSGAPQTVIDIVKQPDEPFEIVSISPPLPQMIADGARQTFSVLTERAAGSGRATARRPYFEITLSCGMLTLASEPSLLMPLQPNDVQVKLQGNHLQVEAQGANIATVRLQLYDLLGRLILDQEGRGNTMVLPAKTAQDTPLANGVYLYVVRVRGFDDREYVSEVRKLVIMR
jgi:hypothetical protein